MPVYRLESTYAPLAGALSAARGDWSEATADAYAASTLELPVSFGAATPTRAVVGKLLLRGALIPPPAALARRAGDGPRAPARLRAAHWAQAAAWLAGGVPATVDADLPDMTRGEARAAAAWGLADLAELWGLVARLYGEEVPELPPLELSESGLARSGRLGVAASRGASGAPFAFSGRAEPVPAREAPGVLEALLARLLGHAAFRPGQREAVAALLAGRDAAASLATAAGKSAIFQLAGLLRPGTCVVVEPLVALARDQKRALAERGVRSAALHAERDDAADLARLSGGRLPFVFVSPERLDAPRFREALRSAVEACGVGLLAFDEAHCAADWGHDFRPAYASVGARARLWCSDERGGPPSAALTGTASPRALSSAAARLGLREPSLVRGSSARPELSFAVERLGAGDDPLAALERFFAARRPGPGEALVFCPRVDGPLGATEAARRLAKAGLRAGAFTGRPPDGRPRAAWESEREAAAAALRERALDVLCCTTAFSLGVDVPSVRLVARVGLPDSLEALFQEAGRAGRQAQPSLCVLFAREREDARSARRGHAARFPGEDSEAADVALLAARLAPWGAPRRAALRLEGRSPAAVGRALARLEAAGALRVERRGEDVFEVELAELGLAAATEAGLREVARVYAEVEPARRASLEALIAAVNAEEPGAALTAALGRLSEHEPAEQLEIGIGRPAPRHVFVHAVAARLRELLGLVVKAARPRDAFR